MLISTGDKDMAQLVDGSITLINTMSNSTLDRAGVKAKFDVYPEQIIDYLALVGDSSDNIPGIEKVGPKTAAKWLGQYGTLDNLVAHAAEISGKVGENLRAGLATLELSRKLATIRTDIEVPLSSEQLIPSAPEVESSARAVLALRDEDVVAAVGGGDGWFGRGGGRGLGVPEAVVPRGAVVRARRPVRRQAARGCRCGGWHGRRRCGWLGVCVGRRCCGGWRAREASSRGHRASLLNRYHLARVGALDRSVEQSRSVRLRHRDDRASIT